MLTAIFFLVVGFGAGAYAEAKQVDVWVSIKGYFVSKA